MKEGAIGMGALTFDVVENSTAHLAGRGNSDDGGILEGLTSLEWQLTVHGTAHLGMLCRASAERMFEAKEDIPGSNWGALHGADHLRTWQIEIEKSNFSNRSIGWRGQRNFLPDVIVAVAESDRPDCGELSGRVFQVDYDSFAQEMLFETCGLRIGLHVFDARRIGNCH